MYASAQILVFLDLTKKLARYWYQKEIKGWAWRKQKTKATRLTVNRKLPALSVPKGILPPVVARLDAIPFLVLGTKYYELSKFLDPGT